MNWVKWVQQQLHSYDMRVLSSVIIITQSGIKNIENVKFWGLLPCGMIPWQPLPMFRYYVCTIRGHLNNNEEVYSKVAASECYLGEGNLIFFCTGPIDSNFWQIKIIIIILISHVFLSPNMIFFFWVAIKSIKNKNLVHLTTLNHSTKRCGHFLWHKIIDDQYFSFAIWQTLNLGLLFCRPTELK